MLDFGEILAVISPVKHLLPVIEIFFIIEDSSIALNLLESNIVSKGVKFAILNAIINVLMGYIFPRGVPFIHLGFFK